MIPYHIERGDVQLSLEYVESSEEAAERVQRDLLATKGGVDVVTEIRKLETSSESFGVYSAELYPSGFDVDLKEEVSGSNLPIVDSIVTIFLGIADRWRERGRPLRWYKQLSPGMIEVAINRVTWKRSVLDVGGDLFSNFVIKHPMPNANHRTAIGLVKLYLQSMDRTLELPDTGDFEGEWFGWAEELILESKQLLVVQRKDQLLEHLAEKGCRGIVLSQGQRIGFQDIDFDSNLKSAYSSKHLDLSRKLISEIIARSNSMKYRSIDRLGQDFDDGKRTFIQRLV